MSPDAQEIAARLRAALTQEALAVPEERWRPMLVYLADLHARSVRPAQPPLPHPWTQIGPGYCYGPAPCRDYLGHNPLFAMVRMHRGCRR